jgi:hypothetical protein
LELGCLNGWRLLLMPGEQHVFLAILAGVADERKAQCILVRSAKLVNAGALAGFRRFASGALNCNGVPGDCVGTPDITCAIMISIDVKRAVGLHRPDCAE